MQDTIKLSKARENKEFILKPLISVRIPTLNRSKLIMERAIPSVFGQTYKNVEVVVVGDHCTDDTEKELDYISKRVNRTMKWYNLPERSKKEKELLKDPEMRWFIGPVRATNRATELCVGEWIAHLDDDDFWTEHHLEDLLNFAQAGDYEMVYGDYLEVRYGKEKVVENGPSTWFMKKYVADIFRLDDKCWKKKTDRVSDIDVFERMKSAGVRIGHFKQVIAYVLPRPGEETVGFEAYKKYNPFGNIK